MKPKATDKVTGPSLRAAKYPAAKDTAIDAMRRLALELGGGDGDTLAADPLRTNDFMVAYADPRTRTPREKELLFRLVLESSARLLQEYETTPELLFGMEQFLRQFGPQHPNAIKLQLLRKNTELAAMLIQLQQPLPGQKPPGPGGVLQAQLEANTALNAAQIAAKLGMEGQPFDDLLAGKIRVDEHLASKLSAAIPGTSPVAWLQSQRDVDGFEAMTRVTSSARVV